MKPSNAHTDDIGTLHCNEAAYPSVRYSSLPRRAAAMFYDIIAVAALWFGATALLLALITGGEAIPPGNPMYALYLASVATAYFVVSWRMAGQTLGMRAWRLRLVGDHGESPRTGRLIARAVLGAVSLACLGLGFLWALGRPDRRTWHDLATGTRLERAD